MLSVDQVERLIAKSYAPLKPKYEILEYDETQTNFHEVSYLGYKMPGSEGQQHVWCGQWSAVGCLENQLHENKMDYVRRFQKSCYKANCSVCWKKWLAREANKATKRIEKYTSENRLPKHVVVSVPVWLYHEELKTLRKLARLVLKAVHCEAGTMIFHAYRRNKVDGSWYYSPHFHVVGFGWIVGTAEKFKENGWIAVNLGIRKSVFQTMFYQLSHCAVGKNHKHTVTWFGNLSYSKVPTEKEPKKDKKCPYCGNCLIELEPYGSFKPPDEEFEGPTTHGLYYHPESVKWMK
jgi:hypothetical protein